MRTTTTLLLAIVLLASCNQYQKTPSGLAYKISGGKGEKLKQGQFVKFHVEYRIPPKDSVFNSSFGHIPGYMVVDTARVSKHSFLEIITKCAVGDKVDFTLSVDTLNKLGMLDSFRGIGRSTIRRRCAESRFGQTIESNVQGFIHFR